MIPKRGKRLVHQKRSAIHLELALAQNLERVLKSRKERVRQRILVEGTRDGDRVDLRNGVVEVPTRCEKLEEGTRKQSVKKPKVDVVSLSSSLVCSHRFVLCF